MQGGEQESQHRFELGSKARRVFSGGPIARFRCHDDAATNMLFADLCNAIGHLAARVAHEV